MGAETCKWDIALTLHDVHDGLQGLDGDRTDAAGHPLHPDQDWSGQVLLLNRQQQRSPRADDQRRGESPPPQHATIVSVNQKETKEENLALRKQIRGSRPDFQPSAIHTE